MTIVVCSLDPHLDVESEVTIEMAALGLAPNEVYLVHDEITGQTWRWGSRNFVRLTVDDPAHVLTIVSPRSTTPVDPGTSSTATAPSVSAADDVRAVDPTNPADRSTA